MDPSCQDDDPLWQRRDVLSHKGNVIDSDEVRLYCGSTGIRQHTYPNPSAWYVGIFGSWTKAPQCELLALVRPLVGCAYMCATNAADVVVYQQQSVTLCKPLSELTLVCNLKELYQLLRGNSKVW